MQNSNNRVQVSATTTTTATTSEHLALLQLATKPLAPNQKTHAHTCKDVVLIVDVSGSMNNVITQVQQTLKQVCSYLNAKRDQFAIVLFNDKANTILPLQAPNLQKLDKVLHQVQASGGTSILAGIQLAVTEAKQRARSDAICQFILLSDGQDSKTVFAESQKLMHEANVKVFVHTFGFDSNHDAELLQQLTGIGRAGSGMYYNLERQEDIHTSIGDCLGRSQDIVALSIDINCSHGTFMNTQTSNTSVAMLTEGETQTLVLKCDNDKNVILKISYKDVGKQEQVQMQETIVFSHAAPSIIDEHRVKTHLLRINAASMLEKAADPAGSSVLEHIENLHAQVLDAIEEIQLVETTQLVQEEGILQALERDLGEALDNLYVKVPIRNFRARLLQYALEHANQRSASSISNTRTIYATKAQNAARLRFLYTSDASISNTDPQKFKAAVQLEDKTLSKEQIQRRNDMEEDACFISLENWRCCTMGIGLLVKPKTARDRRRKLMPRADIVPDYCSSEAFNEGVQTMIQTNHVNREDDDDEEHKVLPSSIRGRINGWLPIYINEAHWKYAKAFAPSAFSIIATQFNDMFKPQYALAVCSKLLIQNIVKAVIEEDTFSDRALQMYCDIHRLFLQMAFEYPSIVTEAESKLEAFISNPQNRIRKHTPDLGDLLHYLFVTDKYKWSDLKESYIQESYRRSAFQMGHVNFNLVRNGVPGLIGLWNENTNAGRVTMFNCLFMSILAKPEEKTIKDVAAEYDSRWGKVSLAKLAELKSAYERVKKMNKVQETLPEILGRSVADDAIAEMMLWAIANKDDTNNIQYNGIPENGGAVLQDYMHRIEMHSKALPAAEYETTVAAKQLPRKKNYSGIAGFLKRAREDNVDDEPEAKRFCQTCTCLSCQRNERLAAEAKQRTRLVLKTNADCTLFVAHLDKTKTTSQQLVDLFSKYGKVTNVTLVQDCKKNKFKGYAFVTFGKQSNAARVLKDYTENKTKFQLHSKMLVIEEEQGRTDATFLPIRFHGIVSASKQ